MTREDFNKRFDWVYSLDSKQKMHVVTGIMSMILVPDVILEGFLENLTSIINDERK